MSEDTKPKRSLVCPKCGAELRDVKPTVSSSVVYGRCLSHGKQSVRV